MVILIVSLFLFLQISSRVLRLSQHLYSLQVMQYDLSPWHDLSLAVFSVFSRVVPFFG